MEVKLLSKKEFYPTFEAWSKEHEFLYPFEKNLPNQVLVCFSENIAIYSVWLYRTDSEILWIGWPMSNRLAPKEIKAEGLKFLIKEVEQYALGNGYSTIFTTSATEKMITALTELNYVVGDIGVQQMIKML